MDVNSDCKICVLGPSHAGKTLLCRVLTKQTLFPQQRYKPADDSIVRIYRFTCSDTKLSQRTQATLWDCSGSLQTVEENADVFSQGVDGVILAHNPKISDHEYELENLYKKFVQPLKLSKKQCMVVAINSTGGLVGSTLTGSLSLLPQSHIDITLSSPHLSRNKAVEMVNQLIVNCVASRLLQAEEEVITDGL